MSSASERVVGWAQHTALDLPGLPSPGRPQQLLVSAKENSKCTLGFTAMVVGHTEGQKTSRVVSTHGGVSWNMPHSHGRVALDGYAWPCAGLRVGPGLPTAEPARVGA